MLTIAVRISIPPPWQLYFCTLNILDATADDRHLYKKKKGGVVCSKAANLIIEWAVLCVDQTLLCLHYLSVHLYLTNAAYTCANFTAAFAVGGSAINRTGVAFSGSWQVNGERTSKATKERAQVTKLARNNADVT